MPESYLCFMKKKRFLKLKVSLILLLILLFSAKLVASPPVGLNYSRRVLKLKLVPLTGMQYEYFFQRYRSMNLGVNYWNYRANIVKAENDKTSGFSVTLNYRWYNFLNIYKHIYCSPYLKFQYTHETNESELFNSKGDLYLGVNISNKHKSYPQ